VTTLRRSVGSLALLLAAVAPASAQQAPGSDAAGVVCLTLRLVPNPDGADPARWGRVHHPPDTVALDGLVVEVPGRAPGHRVRPRISDPRITDWWPPHWRMSGDSLEMVWHTGLTGVWLRGRLVGGSYSGEATLITDAVTTEPLPTAFVEGRSIECPARFRERDPHVSHEGL
jgi:hypothetical protein